MNNFKLPKFKSFTIILLFLLSFSMFSQTGTSEINKDSKIDKLINLRKDYMDQKFRIQIYSGSLKNCESRINEFRMKFSQVASLKYETPTYKVWVGNFKTKLQADRALLKIKEEFPGSFIFESK